jgi:hypothetical protein
MEQNMLCPKQEINLKTDYYEKDFVVYILCDDFFVIVFAGT